MKLFMKSKQKAAFPHSGFAIDEAILATVMTASLAAVVVVSVPWNKMFTDGVQIASYLETIEKGNAAFYAQHQLWPHETTGGDPILSVSALTSTEAMKWPYNTMVSFKNHISDITPGFMDGGVKHTYGNGGLVVQEQIIHRGQRYLQVTLKDVPLEDARALDKEIDGNYNPSVGRVTLGFESHKTDMADVKYRANALDI